MAQLLPFGEVLEAADHLSAEEQEELIAILHRRLAQAARQREFVQYEGVEAILLQTVGTHDEVY